MDGNESTAGFRPRVESVDLLRGVIMVIMALDHTRDFFGVPGQNPTNMETTNAALFFTRWITHFCAPAFFLLTGTGSFLSLKRKTNGELSAFLFTRGLWLIFLEIVVVRCLAYQFNFDFRVTLLLVLWALGWSMITLSLLVRFPAYVAAVFGVVLITAHNLFDGAVIANPIWNVLHTPGFLVNTPRYALFVSYPLIPWIGVTALGFALGQVFDWPALRRRQFLLRAGSLATLAFAVLRAINVYGDPSRWSQQKSAAMTVLSFLNTTKYPPSLLFLLMTLGPAMVVLALFDRGTPPWLERARTIGKVPLFYFVLHFVLIHLLAVITCLIQYGTAHWMFESPDLGNYPFTPPPGWGFSLPGVYAIWVLVVVLSYPLCSWFAKLKQRRKEAWLSYL